MNRYFEHNSLSLRGTVFLGFFLKKFTVFLYLALIIGAVLYPAGVFAQTNIKSNLEVFEQEISGELEKFFFMPGVNRDVKFVFWVSSPKKSKEDKKFIESVVKKTADRNKLKYSIAKDEVMDSPDTVYNKCAITVNKLYTEYTKLIKNGFLGEKSMQREITSSLGIHISLNNGEVLVSDEIKTKYDDEIPYDDYTQFESAEYKFTQSSQPDISLLESIFFPVAVVSLSAVAAILFFSIRSK